MKLRDMTIHNYGGYELDTNKIGKASICKDTIRLPYLGKLPTACNWAAITFQLTVECIDVILEMKAGSRKPMKCTVEAEQEEIDHILWSFFFETGEKQDTTRFNNGLSEYWNGFYQAKFIEWHKIRTSPQTLCKILEQLTKSQQKMLYRKFDEMEREDTAAG